MTKAILLLDYHVPKNLFCNRGILRQGDATMDKNVTKSLLFFHFQFLLAFLLTTVLNNNIDDTRGPTQFNFANQFNCIIQMKLKVFVLKVATIDPFYKRNVITRVDLPNGAVPGALC